MKKEIEAIKTVNNIEELKKLLSEAQRGQLDLRVENSLRKLKNYKSIGIKRKEIALIKTMIKSKEIVK